MNNEDIEKKIDTIPLFEERKVLTGDINDLNGLYNQREYKAIAEKDSNQAIAFVSKHYVLIQFRDAFRKVIKDLENIDGKVYYFFGRSQMDIYPKDSQVGLCISNSVDRTWALRVDFIASIKEGTVFIPSKVLGFRHKHMGNVKLAYGDFVDVITKAQSSWDTITTKMNSIKLDDDGIEDIKKILKAGNKLKEAIDLIYLNYDNSITLWDMFREVITVVSKRVYKSDIHRRLKLSHISTVLLNYALITEA
jgi:hypothetical protein